MGAWGLSIVALSSPTVQLALTVIVVSAALAASADPAARPLTWTATRGSVQPGLLPGSLVLATDAAPGRYSEGSVAAPLPVSIPFQLDATLRRLGPEAGRSLHLGILGGIVLIKTGAVSLWGFSDSKYNFEGWSPLPGMRTNDEHRFTVLQDERTVVLSVDGVEVKRFSLVAARKRGPVGIGFKGASGLRSRLYVRSLSVREVSRLPGETRAPARAQRTPSQ